MVTVSAARAGDGSRLERIELCPNGSLTPRGAVLVAGSLATLTLTLAGLLALQGLWPVLPFAGLEIALLIWALHASMRSSRQHEVIEVSGDSLVISKTAPAPALVFPRYWARVKLRGPHRPQLQSSLVIESHGRACEVGRFLTEEERRGLAERLQQLVGKASDLPAHAAL